MRFILATIILVSFLIFQVVKTLKFTIFYGITKDPKFSLKYCRSLKLNFAVFIQNGAVWQGF